MQRSVLNLIEINEQKILSVRFTKEVVENGAVVSSKYHRTAFVPHQDIDVQMAAVNQHLEQLGFTAISELDIGTIKAVAAEAWQGVEPWSPEM